MSLKLGRGMSVKNMRGGMKLVRSGRTQVDLKLGCGREKREKYSYSWRGRPNHWRYFDSVLGVPIDRHGLHFKLKEMS